MKVRVRVEPPKAVTVSVVVLVRHADNVRIGPKTITENGTFYPANESLDGYSPVVVDVNAQPKLQDKTVDPAIVPVKVKADPPNDGLDEVTVNAMPVEEQVTPQITVDEETGVVTARASQPSGYVVGGTKENSKQLKTKGAQIYTPGDEEKIIPARVFLTGAQTIAKVPTQEKTVTENGEYEADAGKYFKKFTVNVPATEQTPPKLQEKSADPSTTQQEFTPDPGYDGISKFIVNAVRQAAQGEPTIAVDDAGKVTATVTQEEGYVPAGTKSASKQLNTKAAATYTPGDSKQTIPAGVFLTGDQTIDPVPVQEKTATENGEVVADPGKYLTKVIVDVQPEVDGEVVLDPTDVKFGSEAIDPDQLYKIGYNWLAQVVDHLQDMVGRTSSFTLEEIVYWLGRVKYIPQGFAESTLALDTSMFASNASGILPDVQKGTATSVLTLDTSLFTSSATGALVEG